MILTALALTSAAVFTGAAAYINWSEQPARLTLDDAALLREWKLSYAKGAQMQAPLALFSGLFALGAFFFNGDAFALPGGVLMLMNWPYTLLAINPINKRLGAMGDGADPRPLIEKWGTLHSLRTLLGVLAVLVFLFASAGP